MNTADSLRERLLDVVKRSGVLVAGPDQPVVDRAGRSAPWMFYSWNFMLTADGATLAAEGVLDVLKSSFSGTQLATFGTTGLPLLTATVMLSGGRCTGICVREHPKGHSEGRQIEGPADPAQPVVIVDDSLSSGKSALACARVLEERGFVVEGVVCLVHFPHRGGRERLEALGYRVETLFDIWDDVGMARSEYVPGHLRVGQLSFASERVPDGLTPAEAARVVAERLNDDGKVLLPPTSFDAEYKADGGVWVSVRRRVDEYRLAREGFWHFDPADADPRRDVVLATAKTIGASGGVDLSNVKLGVTFFGALEGIGESAVDFPTYGLVVRSRAWPVKVGGALPNTQVFTSEREQLNLAKGNARLNYLEPYELFRHTVTKYIEPGDTWLPYGAPEPPADWTTDAELGETLTRRALSVAVAGINGRPVTADALDPVAIPVAVSAVSVTLYRDGKVAGCSVSWRRDVTAALDAAATAAIADTRFGALTRTHLGQLAVGVAILYCPEYVGRTSVARAAKKLRLGRDSLAVKDGDRQAVLLSAVAPHYDWSKNQLGERLLEKAGIASGSTPAWTIYRTATWLRAASTALPQQYGFVGSARSYGDDRLRDDLELVGGYLNANIRDNGLPTYARIPVPGWCWPNGTAARVIHGLSGLHAAGATLGRIAWQKSAADGIRSCLEAVEVGDDGRGELRLDDQRCGPMADCEILASAGQVGVAADLPCQTTALALHVAAMLQTDGSIHPHRAAIRADRDNDYLPNAVILALAGHYSTRDDLAEWLDPYRARQLRRFELLGGWGQAGWLPQACAAVFHASGDERWAQTAFTVADWSVERQVATTGAYLTDLGSDGPTFHTAFVAEGIADAWGLAEACGESARARRYASSWHAAMRFSRSLILRPEDAAILDEPATSVGGVRGSLTSGLVRIDFASHMAISMCKGLRLAGVD